MASQQKNQLADNETINAAGTEKKVETVDYQSSAGHADDDVTKKQVEVIHECNPSDAHQGKGAGGVVASAVSAVAAAAESAKEAVSGGKGSKK